MLVLIGRRRLLRCSAPAPTALLLARRRHTPPPPTDCALADAPDSDTAPAPRPLQRTTCLVQRAAPLDSAPDSAQEGDTRTLAFIITVVFAVLTSTVFSRGGLFLARLTRLVLRGVDAGGARCARLGDGAGRTAMWAVNASVSMRRRPTHAIHRSLHGQPQGRLVVCPASEMQLAIFGLRLS
ncbi:hypothetical protein C8R44DRAFT_889701 [Mycena epipterygia]|nr:hypothetical protein C8R44DRAFT_889701 [Mycena epipterygia]